MLTTVALAGRLPDDDHVVSAAILAAIVAALVLVYLWKRHRLRRERS